jgi:curved DNA-binding protein CbpA
MTDTAPSSLVELLALVDKQDWYALLGVTSHASVDGIKFAYLDLVRRCHPDVFRGAHEKAHAKRVSDGLVEAWLTLSDATKRAAYDRQRSGKAVAVPRVARDPRAEAELARLLTASSAALGVRRVEAAKVLHRHGATLFSQRDLEGAERYLRRAYELDPTVADHSLATVTYGATDSSQSRAPSSIGVTASFTKNCSASENDSGPPASLDVTSCRQSSFDVGGAPGASGVRRTRAAWGPIAMGAALWKTLLAKP